MKDENRDKRSLNIRISVNNLSYDITEDALRHEFGAFGEVVSVILIKNKFDGISRGSAYVEMLKTSEGLIAIPALNGKMLSDRAIVVKADRNWSELRKYSHTQPQKPREV